MKSIYRVYSILWTIIWPFFSLCHPCRAIGKENLPKSGALFCANHSCLNDPVCLVMAVGRRYQLRPMAKSEFMNIPVLGWLLKKAGVFAVDRGKSDVGAIKTAMKYLKNGEKVLLFPEGTRVKDGVDKHGHESEAKSGAAMLAAFALGAEGVQVGTRFALTAESSAHEAFKQHCLGLGEGDTRLLLKKVSPTRLAKGHFMTQVEEAEDAGATAEQLKDLLGKGRAKRGIFEGDLEQGELEIGQAAAMIDHIETAAEVVEDMVGEYNRLLNGLDRTNF